MKKKSAKPTHERYKINAQEFLQALYSDIDPAKYAGEGWFATEEYDPVTIRDPHVLGDIIREGEYYPAPVFRKPRGRR
jgi:hypothetical protein